MAEWADIAASNLEAIVNRVPEPLKPAFRAVKISQLSPMAPICASILDTTNPREKILKHLPRDLREDLAKYHYPEWSAPPRLDELCASFCKVYVGASFQELDERFEVPAANTHMKDSQRNQHNKAVEILNEV
jgi:hypothetical protein